MTKPNLTEVIWANPLATNLGPGSVQGLQNQSLLEISSILSRSNLELESAMKEMDKVFRRLDQHIEIAQYEEFALTIATGIRGMAVAFPTEHDRLLSLLLSELENKAGQPIYFAGIVLGLHQILALYQKGFEESIFLDKAYSIVSKVVHAKADLPVSFVSRHSALNSALTEAINCFVDSTVRRYPGEMNWGRHLQRIFEHVSGQRRSGEKSHEFGYRYRLSNLGELVANQWYFSASKLLNGLGRAAAMTNGLSLLTPDYYARS
jgi:hypothetical protein